MEKLKILGLITNIENYQKIYSHVWKKLSQEDQVNKVKNLDWKI